MSVATHAIKVAARKYGLDETAMLQVAQAESGLNPQNISDGGTSFGLFQLHQGGALGNMSNAQARRYLDPYLNADFAARQMRQMGLHKFKGAAAVEQMVRRFERPANPGAEIQRALGYTPLAHPSPAPAAMAEAKAPVAAQADAQLLKMQGAVDANAKLAHIAAPTLPASIPLHVKFADGVTRQTAAPPTAVGGAIVAAAKHFLGIKYTWGGTTPKTGFDCSALMQYVFKKFGINIPRVSEEQFLHGHQVAQGAQRPGDLIFFRHANGDVGHVGLYIGNGQFLHAPHTGDVVKISNLAGYGLPVAGVRRYAA